MRESVLSRQWGHKSLFPPGRDSSQLNSSGPSGIRSEYTPPPCAQDGRLEGGEGNGKGQTADLTIPAAGPGLVVCLPKSLTRAPHSTAICVCAGRDDKPQVFKLPLEHFLTYLYVEAVCLKELFRFRQEKTEVIHNKWGCEQ